MLHVEIDAPEGAGDGSPVAVLLHGRGADEGDLLGLAPELPDDLIVVTPRAPFEGREWGYGMGWAWYRYVAEDRVVPETLERSLGEIEELLDELPGILEIEPGPVGLGGFSQGGTVSLAYALRHPATLAFVVNMSGFLVDGPAIEVTSESVAGTPVFWGHGLHDPAIPHRLAEKGRTKLNEAGADLTARDYPMGHGVSPEELREISGWLTPLLTP